MKKYKVIVYKNLGKGLIDSWKCLWLRSKYANFFNSYEFHIVCKKNFLNDNYEIFCLEKNGEVVAILPLIKGRVFGFPCYVNPGGRFIEKSPFLVKDNNKDDLKILIDFVLKKGNIRLSEVPQDIAENLRTGFKESLISIISVNPFINLRDKNYLGLNKKNLSKLENRIRRNRKSLEHLHIRGDGEKQLKRVIDLEDESHKSMKGKQIFDDKTSRLFYKNLIQISKDKTVFDFLTYDRKIFVSAVGILCKDTYYAYHTSYLRGFKYLMPGKTLTYFMLNQLKKEGVGVFDFVRGYSNFKKDFTSNYSIQYDFYLSRNFSINIWWKLINLARRIKIAIFNPKYSNDHLYLFKTLKRL
jgi:hypothetical protein